jgi:hypothetical protein
MRSRTTIINPSVREAKIEGSTERIKEVRWAWRLIQYVSLPEHKDWGGNYDDWQWSLCESKGGIPLISIKDVCIQKRGGAWVCYKVCHNVSQERREIQILIQNLLLPTAVTNYCSLGMEAMTSTLALHNYVIHCYRTRSIDALVEGVPICTIDWREAQLRGGETNRHKIQTVWRPSCLDEQ